MGFIDLPTLVLVLLGAADVGSVGILGVDMISKIAGQYARTIEVMIGLAAIWQFFRQRWLV